MKIRNLLSIGIISSLLFTSCVNNDDFSEWNDGSQPISFSSYIKGLTKASDASWAEGDEVGIFMKNSGSNLSEATRANCKYLTDGLGKMLAATNNDALYYPGEGIAVDFVAYYPYTTSLNGTTYSVNVADQNNQPAIDLLYSNNAKNMSEGNPTLEFSHKLSKVVMNIEADASIASLDGLQISLTGMNTKADFNLENGSLDNASAPAEIKMLVNTTAKTAEAIVLPAALSGVKAVFSLSGYQTEAEISGTYEAGKKYTYTVKLSHSGLKPSIQFGDATITDWTEVPGGDINVDFGDGTEVNPEPGEAIVVTKDQPFTGLTDGQGNFTINNVQLPEGSDYVWEWSTQYNCMKASAFVGSAKASESWLISPALDLSQLTKATLTFQHAHKFAGTPAQELTLWVTEASAENWAQLTIDQYGTNNDYNFVSASIDLSAYTGKTIKLAFKYVSSTSAAATWEVKDVKVAEGDNQGGGTVDPDPDPVDGVIFTETLGYINGNTDANKVKISAFDGWDNSTLTFSDSYNAADIRAIAYKTPDNTSETAKVNNVWFPSGKDSELVISGIDTEGYKTLTLTYQSAANVFNSGTSIDLNTLEVYFNEAKANVPSKIVSKDNNDANVFYTMTVELDASAVSSNSSIRFYSPASANNVGLRLTNITLSGTK